MIVAGYSLKAWWLGASVPVAVSVVSGILVGGIVVVAIVTVAVAVKRASARSEKMDGPPRDTRGGTDER